MQTISPWPKSWDKEHWKNFVDIATSQLIAFPPNKPSLPVSYMVLWSEDVVLCDYRFLPAFSIWLFCVFVLWVVWGYYLLFLVCSSQLKWQLAQQGSLHPEEHRASLGFDLSGIKLFLRFSSLKYSSTSFSRSGMHWKWLFQFVRAF